MNKIEREKLRAAALERMESLLERIAIKLGVNDERETSTAAAPLNETETEESRVQRGDDSGGETDGTEVQD